MLFIKAFHLIAVIAWFSGLFYLPRLFVYHADARDVISNTRFKIMERRLYRGIMWPAAILTTITGCLLIYPHLHFYLTQPWMHVKLFLVGGVWGFHGLCGHYRRCFFDNRNSHTARFYRFFNEIPTILLIAIVILVMVRP